MKDCRDCIYSAYAKGTYQCHHAYPSVSTSWARDPRNECGLEARLFEPKPPKMGAENAAK